MVEATSSLPPIRYWVDVIPDDTWQCQRFDCEREALASAQVYARLPNAEAVVAYAYAPEGTGDDLRLERSRSIAIMLDVARRRVNR